jgi:RNA polymerase sigma factor (sigma-70 family)
MPHAQFRQFSDAELVTASIDGQKNAFGEIVRRYQGVVSGLVYNRCHGSISHSEDLAQETFLVAWQRLPTMNSSDCLGSWLCGIARNLTRSASRKRTEQPLQKVIEQAVDAAAEPSHEAISREQERLLWESLGQIPEKYREPMILFYRQDQSTEQVASALGLTPVTIRKRLERGRSMLKDQMAVMVEEKLAKTSPSPAFAFAVLAALPAMSSKAAAATVGGTSAAGLVGTKLSALLVFLAGPLIGLLGGLFGTWNSIRNTRSTREKRFMIRASVAVWLLVGALLVLQFGLLLSRPFLSNAVYTTTMILLWGAYSIVLITLIVKFNRRQRQIQVEDGTDTPLKVPVVARWTTPGAVYGGLGGSIFGTVAWMVMMAIIARDWGGAVAILFVSVLLFVWSTRTILKKGSPVVRRVLVLTVGILAATTLAAINLKFSTWIARGAESRLAVGLFQFPIDRMWILNVIVLIAFGIVLLPILMTKDFGRRDCV